MSAVDSAISPTRPAPLLTRISDIPLRPVRWLWPGRIPLGKLTLLMGEPGLGKSLVALDIAARLSKGLAWPDAPGTVPILARKNGDSPASSPLAGNGGKPVPASVLLLTSSDDPGDTIRPRLEAAGAILHKIRILGVPPVPSLAVPGSVPATRINGLTNQRINDPLDSVERALTATPDCRLIVIDPLEAFLDSSGASSPGAARALLNGLTALAEKHNVAILLITHLNRRGLGAAQSRSIAALGLLANVRIAWTIAKDADPRGTSRLLIPLKNNLGHDNLALAFHINDSPTRWGIPKVNWEPDPIYTSARSGSDSGGSGQSSFNHRDHRGHRGESASKLQASGRSVSVASVPSVVNSDFPSKPGPEPAGIALASTWLRDALSRRPMNARDIFTQAHAALAVSEHTLRRAAHGLPITIRRDNRANVWTWTWNAAAEVGCHWPAAESSERPTSASIADFGGRCPKAQRPAPNPEAHVRGEMSDVSYSEPQTSNITTSNIAPNLEPKTLNPEPYAATPARAQSARILAILAMWLEIGGLRRLTGARGSWPSASPNLAMWLAGLSMMLGMDRRCVAQPQGGGI